MNLRNSDNQFIFTNKCQHLAIIDLQVSNGPNGSFFFIIWFSVRIISIKSETHNLITLARLRPGVYFSL